MAINTYTSDLGAAEGRIASLTKAVSSGYSGLPGVSDALRKSLYEREKTLPALERENEAKIKELYTADQRYAERYGSPESEMYIEDPMQRQALVSGQKADIRGELGNILNLIQQRSQTMGNAIDKGMELYKYGLEAQKIELDQAEKSWSRIMEKARFEESKKKAAPKDYSSTFKYLQAIAQPSEQKPLYSPVKKDAMSKGGDWKYDAGLKDWTPADPINEKLQAILRMAETDPEVAHVAIQNWPDWNPKEEDLTLTEEFRQDLQTARNAVNSGTKSFEEALADMQNAYPDKSITTISQGLTSIF